GRLLAALGDGTIRFLDADTGKEVDRQDLKVGVGHLRSAAFSPDGHRVLVGLGTPEKKTSKAPAKDARRDFTDCSLRLWDLTAGKELRQLGKSIHLASRVAVSPDGLRGLSGSDDGKVHVWNLESGRELYCFEKHKANDAIYALAFAPKG